MRRIWTVTMMAWPASRQIFSGRFGGRRQGFITVFEGEA